MNAEDLAYRVARRFTAASRVAARYFELKYALDLSRMTVQEAKGILGLPPGAFTKDDLTKAYRTKAIENHPDRGGDIEKMKAVNLAKDKLTKELEGPSKSWVNPTPWSGPGEYKRDPRPPRWQDDPETKIVEGQSFAQAWGNSGAPPNTEWKFVSNPVYSWRQSFYPSEATWTLYGVTESKHVFLSFKRRAEGSGVIPTKEYGPKTHFNEDWQSSVITLPITQPALKVIPKSIKAVSTAWADGAAPKAPTKFVAWPGGHPTAAILDKIHHSGGVTLKDILLGTGILKDDSSEVAGRKTQVEIITMFNREKDKTNRQLMREGKRKSMGVIDQFDFFVRINGKQEQLAQATLEKMDKMVIPWGLGYDKIDDKRVFNLTKKRGGWSRLSIGAAEIINLLADCLTTEPSWVHLGLQKAAEEYESESKTAGLLRLASEMTTEDAANFFGVSAYDFIKALAS